MLGKAQVKEVSRDLVLLKAPYLYASIINKNRFRKVLLVKKKYQKYYSLYYPYYIYKRFLALKYIRNLYIGYYQVSAQYSKYNILLIYSIYFTIVLFINKQYQGYINFILALYYIYYQLYTNIQNRCSRVYLSREKVIGSTKQLKLRLATQYKE